MSCTTKAMNYFIDKSENHSKPHPLGTGKGGINAMFSHTPYMMYDSQVGPNYLTSPCTVINNLNTELGVKPAECFHNFEYKENEVGAGYTRQFDGRLVDSPRNMLTTLDRPPNEGDIGSLHNVYSDKLSVIKDGYLDGYDNIKSGQIRYYTDSQLLGGFPNRTGNWITSAHEDYFMYKNPMGVVELQTDRQPITKDRRPNYLCGQNFMKDSMSQREDLMARQSYYFNKNNYQARYKN